MYVVYNLNKLQIVNENVMLMDCFKVMIQRTTTLT